jgi:hypothetical protein
VEMTSKRRTDFMRYEVQAKKRYKVIQARDCIAIVAPDSQYSM